MKLPHKVIDSVVGGHGLTGDGVMLLAQAFAEPSAIKVVSGFHSSRDPGGINHRLLAVAFAVTQPAGMKPPQREGKE